MSTKLTKVTSNNKRFLSRRLAGGGNMLLMAMEPINENVQQTLGVISKAITPLLEGPSLVVKHAVRGYSTGGNFNKINDAVGTGLEMAGSIVQGVNDVKDRAKKITEDVKDVKVDTTPSMSTDELLGKYSAFTPPSHIGWKDLTNKGTFGSTFLDAFSLGSLGAASGSSFSPIGAVVGGVAGIASGIAGNLFAKAKAKKEAGKINDIIDTKTIAQREALDSLATLLDQTMLQGELKSLTGWEAAEGGPLIGKRYDYGGDLSTHGATFDSGLTVVGNGGTHEENPYQGVLMGINPLDGIPNLVEEGEVIHDDYVYSHQTKVDDDLMERYKLSQVKDKNGKKLNPSYADAVLASTKESLERPNDPISKRGLDAIMADFRNNLEMERLKKAAIEQARQQKRSAKEGLIAHVGADGLDLNAINNLASQIMSTPIEDTDLISTSSTSRQELLSDIATPDTLNYFKNLGIDSMAKAKLAGTELSLDLKDRVAQEKKNNVSRNLLRYAPAMKSGIDYLLDMFGLSNRFKGDLGKGIRNANNYLRDVSAPAVGLKQIYRPQDLWGAINNLNALMAALRAAMGNSGNRVGAAGNLLAAAYNQNKALGSLYAGMERENLLNLNSAIAANNALEQSNRAALLLASQINAGLDLQRANNAVSAAKADDAEITALANARQANADKFYTTLGTIGKENREMDMIAALGKSGVFGTPNETLIAMLKRLGVDILKS